MCKNVPRGTIHSFKNFDAFFITLIALGTIQSIIGIAQVTLQHSIGLSFLRESLISPNIPGVAKLVIHGNKYIRAYGLFPHPNILGGFLIISVVTTWLYMKLHQSYSSAKQSASLDKKKCSTWNNITLQTKQTIPNLLVNKTGVITLLYVILAIQLFALLLSFSKSAIIGLILTMLYTAISHLSHGSKLFHVEQFGFLLGKPSRIKWDTTRTRTIILVLFITLIGLFLVSKDLKANLNQSITERLTYLNVSRGTILASPIIGIGSGQYIWNMQMHKGKTLETWQFQPVHNVFLLIWSELGIVGLVLFVWFLIKLFHVEHYLKHKIVSDNHVSDKKESNIFSKNPICSSVGKSEGDSAILCNECTYLSNNTLLAYFKGILFGFIFIMLFDHYFWDIWQGQIMLWMVLGIIAEIRRN